MPSPNFSCEQARIFVKIAEPGVEQLDGDGVAVEKQHEFTGQFVAGYEVAPHHQQAVSGIVQDTKAMLHLRVDAAPVGVPGKGIFKAAEIAVMNTCGQEPIFLKGRQHEFPSWVRW